jgi:hypothetical protein
MSCQWPRHNSGFNRRLPTAAARVPAQVRSVHVGFVVDKLTLVQVYSSTSVSAANSHSTTTAPHSSSSSSSIIGPGQIDQLVADVPTQSHLTPPQETKKKHALHGKVIFPQLFKEFPSLYVPQRPITVFIRALLWFPP